MTFFLSLFWPQCFQGLILEPVGGWVCVCVFPPQHVGMERFREVRTSSVLGLVLPVVAFTQFHSPPGRVFPVSRSPGTGKVAEPLWGGRMGLFPCVTFPVSLWKEESHRTCGFPGALLFSGALAMAVAMCVISPKLEKQSKRLLSAHCSQSGGHWCFFWKSPPPTPHLPTTPLLFLMLNCHLQPFSHVPLSLRAVHWQVCPWVGIAELFPCTGPWAARTRDKSPYRGLAPIVRTV